MQMKPCLKSCSDWISCFTTRQSIHRAEANQKTWQEHTWRFSVPLTWYWELLGFAADHLEALIARHGAILWRIFWKFSMCVITINLSSGWSASIVLRFHQSLTQFSNPSKPTASAYVFECNVRWLHAGLRVVMQKSHGLVSKTVSLEMRMPEYLPEKFMRDVVSSATFPSMLCTCSFFTTFAHASN